MFLDVLEMTHEPISHLGVSIASLLQQAEGVKLPGGAELYEESTGEANPRTVEYREKSRHLPCETIDSYMYYHLNM